MRCNACNEPIQVDEDGSAACECAMIGANRSSIPATWDMSRQELEQARWLLEERAQRAAA
jgi:hypothetical protein